jgi:hypothetical protein
MKLPFVSLLGRSSRTGHEGANGISHNTDPAERLSREGVANWVRLSSSRRPKTSMGSPNLFKGKRPTRSSPARQLATSANAHDKNTERPTSLVKLSSREDVDGGAVFLRGILTPLVGDRRPILGLTQSR